MLPLAQFGLLSALATALTSVLSALLLLALTRQLWSLRWSLTRDKESSLPLPKGSMGWPLIGETFHWLFQILAKVFSRGALESYLPRLQDVVKSEIAKWCSKPGAIDVYSAAKSLTFRIAVRVLLGLQMEEERIVYLAQIFEQLMNNLFSLPIDAPLSGLRKGIKAREILHANMEKIIEEKMERQQAEEEYHDAFDYILSSSKEHGQQLSIQELKETAVELIFAAHSTTASASTSLILQFLRHPAVVERARMELEAEGLGYECNSSHSSSGSHIPYLSLDKLSQLRYVDCVVKEVLRFLPPVSGGYRTALQTFELDGYQIPKGWSVMYSIRDTHETATVFQSPELFDPDRFGPDREESRSARFSYVPFGGGVRSCVGKELAQMILKTLAVELIGTCKWTLATENFPKMQTVPIVHPVNGLHVNFTYNYPL
ncbi:cytochrome P450 26C1 isoform X3 [Anarrhichthys ocellatus]|uniref:cytochrome P450 26C1 isoform X3 n=1 Tax=Anarrhichthys ocellatus TaxID=433405 RepID=UPI0012ED3C4D|nr:cytochrome P450 26C1 isoform X3 [Anarrhichthys ocellatus]